MKDPGRVHPDLAKFTRLFIITEHVDMDKALGLLKKPRYSNINLI